jgi:hypothetical protein
MTEGHPPRSQNRPIEGWRRRSPRESVPMALPPPPSVCPGPPLSGIPGARVSGTASAAATTCPRSTSAPTGVVLHGRPSPGVSLCRGCTRAGERRRKPHLAHVSTPKSPQNWALADPSPAYASSDPKGDALEAARQCRLSPTWSVTAAALTARARHLPRVFGNSLLVRGDSAGRTDRAAPTRRSTGIRARPRA